MTHSVIEVAGTASKITRVAEGGLINSCELQEVIDFPKIIAGKQCLVEATFCNMYTSKPLADNEKVDVALHFDWSLNSTWSQVYDKSNFPQLQPSLGVRELRYQEFYSTGPRLCRLPEGPTPIRFRCFHPLGIGFTRNDSENPFLTIILHIVPVE